MPAARCHLFCFCTSACLGAVWVRSAGGGFWRIACRTCLRFCLPGSRGSCLPACRLLLPAWRIPTAVACLPAACLRRWVLLRSCLLFLPPFWVPYWEFCLDACRFCLLPAAVSATACRRVRSGSAVTNLPGFLRCCCLPATIYTWVGFCVSPWRCRLLSACCLPILLPAMECCQVWMGYLPFCVFCLPDTCRHCLPQITVRSGLEMPACLPAVLPCLRHLPGLPACRLPLPAWVPLHLPPFGFLMPLPPAWITSCRHQHYTATVSGYWVCLGLPAFCGWVLGLRFLPFSCTTTCVSRLQVDSSTCRFLHLPFSCC